MDAIEQALSAYTDDVAFERFARRLLVGEGHNIDVRGGSKDGGRDAVGPDTVYQFSLQKDWESKLGKELKRYSADGATPPKHYVYVTNQRIPALQKDHWQAEYSKAGIELQFYDLDQISSILEKPSHRGLLNELLAPFLMGLDGLIRYALQTPARNAYLQQIDSELKSSVADERLKAARAQLSAHQWDGVIATLDPLLGDVSLTREQRYEAHLHKGNALAQLDRLHNAKTEWTAASALGLSWVVAASNLSTTLLLVDGNKDSAAQVVEKGLLSDPHNSGLIDLQGLIAGVDGRWDRALELHQRAFDLQPRPETLLNLWSARSTLGKPVAWSEVQEARQRFPKDKGIALYEANCLLDRFQAKHDPQLLERIRALLEPALDSVVSGHREWVPGAATPLVFAIDRDWASCALNTYAAVWYWRGAVTEADRLIALALLFGQSEVVTFSAAQAAFAVGDLTRALRGYEAAERAGFGKVELWGQRGNVHYRLFRETGDRAHAEAAEASWLKAASEHSGFFNNVGQLWAELGDRDRAVAFFMRALSANPSDTIALCNVAKLEAGQNNTELLARARTLHERFPVDPYITSLVGEACFHLGMWPEAIAQCDRGISYAGPNPLLLEPGYALGSQARRFQLRGKEGMTAALEFLLEGLRRMPDSAVLKRLVDELVRAS